MIKAVSRKLNSFFINGHERTLLAKKNIVISLLLKGLTIVIGLLLVPMTINYINSTQYGIWLTLSSIISWFNFFDIGLANGLKNKIAEDKAKGDVTNIKAYISTTYAILSIIAISIFIIFLLSNFVLNWNNILNVHNANQINLNNIALIVFASFCIQFILQTFSSILTAFHAISKVSLIYAIGQVGCLISVYILTKTTSGSLLYITIALTTIPLFVQLFSTIWYFKHKYIEFSPSFKVINIKYAKSLLNVGGAFFFVQIGSLLLFQTDNIVVAQLFGPAEVTVFNISYKLFSVVIMAFTIIMNPFWTAFTDAYAKNDLKWIKNIFRKMYKYFVFLILASFVLFVGSPQIFKIWLGPDIKVPSILSLFMMLYAIGVCWMTIHCFLVNGISKIRLQLYLYILSTIINIPLAIILGKYFGVIGIAASNIIILIIMGIVLYVQCQKILTGTARGVWDQ